MFIENRRMDVFRTKFFIQKQRKSTLRFHLWRAVKIPSKEENTNMY